MARGEVDQLGGFTRIMPGNAQFEGVSDKFAKLREFYRALTTSKMPNLVQSAEYEKLYISLPLLKNCGVQRIELHIDFQKATGTQKTVTIFQFYHLVESLFTRVKSK